MRALKEDNRICAWQRHEMEEELWVTHLRQIRILKRMHGIVDEEAVRQHAARKKSEAEVAAIDWAEENENTLRSFADDESDKWDSSKFRQYQCINPSANPKRPREKIPSILCSSPQEDEIGLDRSQQATLFYEDLEGGPEAIEKQEEVQRYEAELEAFHCTSLLPLRRRSDGEKDMWETHIQILVDIKTRRETRMETEDEEKKLAQLNDGVTREDGSDSFVADAGQARSELPEAGASQPDPAPKLMHTTTASVAKQDTDKSSVIVMEPTPPMSEDEVDPSNGKFTPSIEHAQPFADHSIRAELRDVLKKNEAMLDTIRFAKDEIKDIREVQSVAMALQKSQHEIDQQTIKKLQAQAEQYRQERNDAWETAELYLVQRDKALDERNAAYETGEVWVRERDEAWRREEDLSMQLAHLRRVAREA